MPSLQFTGSATKYQDSGVKPGVAGSSESSLAVEIHQNRLGLGPLSYRAGPPFEWPTQPPSVYESNGVMPALANSGNLVVEVHLGVAGAAGPLWYRMAHWLAAGLQWGNSFKFEDMGYCPDVSVVSTQVVEVHVDRVGYGGLWFRTGSVVANAEIIWSSSSQFANGAHPRSL